MNIQAMMKQAQKLQKEMMTEKEKIDKVNGQKEVLSVKIEQEQLDKEDIEMLEDIIVVAINDAMKKVDDTTEQKMGKYTQGMPGLF